ncbi:MAG: sarcosine oxidase subunit alpha family protein [Betaproteobacteria bacterium]|nr:sarcosine oxidase subunit alpha family protein [Betaproteobacteria bacterium]
MSGTRLATGGSIERDEPVGFTFNGRAYRGFKGDTLASALLANGVQVVGRSFKFHRPRGVVALGVEEPNALVQLRAPRQEPNVLATTLPLAQGLAAASVNCWPGPGFDLGAIADRFHRLMPAGFYYKTFMGRGRAWPFFERFIRRAAGLGFVPRELSPVETQRRFAHCDLLVAGAGPAGIAAALAAGRGGARVILADDAAEPGGALLFRRRDEEVFAWIAAAIVELDAMPNVRRLSRTTVFGHYDHGFLAALESRGHDFERVWKIRARRVVIATGATERPLVFPDNDRPGVMLASAATGYLHRYAVACGRRVLVFGNNDSAYESAFELARLGLTVVAIVDTRACAAADLVSQAGRMEIALKPGHTLAAVHGRMAVSGARIARIDVPSQTTELQCDLIAMSGGWNPVLHLHSQAGGKAVYDERLTCFVPGAQARAGRCAGGANGRFDTAGCFEDGAAAGAAAVQALGLEVAPLELPRLAHGPAFTVQAAWMLPRRRGARAFVDLANDVTADDLALAMREGYEAVELAKRYTTAGMGIDQGKTANVNAIGMLAGLAHVSPDSIGTTTFRPPYAPVSFGAIAGIESGVLIRPARKTATTAWHEAQGAIMYESGSNWRRPGYYPRAGESMAQAVARECLAVRGRIGIYDSSPLGKIEVRGPDAGEFLERAYTGKVADLAPGRGRYGIMLREDGRVFDDGVAFRLGERHFWITTTSGNADSVYAWLEYLRQRIFPMRVRLVPVTEQWSNAVLCGPQARKVLQTAGTDIDLTNDGFPFMAMRSGGVAGFPARVFRVSFTGETSYEINVPTRHGLALWEALIAAGRELDIQPIGSEANHVLRVEKGYISVGHEADGMASPDDLGLGRLVKHAKPDFIGKRSLARDAAERGTRRELVGLLTDDPQVLLAEGAQILTANGVTALGLTVGEQAYGQNAAGFVTASVMSPSLGRSIALALLDAGQSRTGESVSVTREQGRGLNSVTARVTRPVFFDPAGERLRG